MNPYQIVGVIAGCSLVFAGTVALLAMQGLPVTVAFLLVYAVALVFMLCMQRRARQSCEDEASADVVPARPPRRTADRHRAFGPQPSLDEPSVDIDSVPASVGDVGHRTWY